MNGQYNADVHRATNKKPLEVFRKRQEFMNGRAEYAAMIEEESEVNSENESENFFIASLENDHSNNARDSSSNLKRSSDCDSSSSDSDSSPSSSLLPSSDDFSTVSQSYSQKYLSSMNQKLQVHLRKFKVGDEVLVAKDFDNNTATRKRPFEAFFRNDTFSIKQVSGKGSVFIQNLQNGEEEWISASRIKKIKK